MKGIDMTNSKPRNIYKFSAEEVRRLFYLEGGTLMNKVDRGQGGRIKAGTPAGNILQKERTAYVRVNNSHNGEQFAVFAHQIVWLMVTGKHPVNPIDHIDYDGLNNRFENLREVDDRCSARHTRKRRNGSSDIKGVQYRKRSDSWEAYITVDYKLIYLGIFKTKIEACQTRRAAEIKYGFDVDTLESSAQQFINDCLS